jgi:hypothetical protein
MGEALDWILPAFAPVPYQILRVMLRNRRLDTQLQVSRRAVATIHIAPRHALEEETGYSLQEWAALLRDIEAIRQNVFMVMDPIVRQKQLTIDWLSAYLREVSPQRGQGRRGLSRTTLWRWQKLGLLDFEESDRLNPDAVATILIARLADTKRSKNWLYAESGVSGEQISQGRQSPLSLGFQTRTRLVCWRQDQPGAKGAPSSALVPIQLPPPAGLRPATLLVSPWQGLLWRAQWRRINSLGVARWAGVDESGRVQVSLDDLVSWHSDTRKFYIRRMETEAPDVFAELADIVLHYVAFSLLSQLHGALFAV